MVTPRVPTMDAGERSRHLEHEASRQRESEREDARARIERGDPAWHHEQGVQAAVDAVRDLEFPLARDEIARRAGARTVQTSDRLAIPMEELVARLPEREFLSIRDFQTELQNRWQAVRHMELPEEQRSPEGGFQPTQRDGWPHHAGKTPRDDSPQGRE